MIVIIFLLNLVILQLTRDQQANYQLSGLRVCVLLTALSNDQRNLNWILLNWKSWKIKMQAGEICILCCQVPICIFCFSFFLSRFPDCLFGVNHFNLGLQYAGLKWSCGISWRNYAFRYCTSLCFFIRGYLVITFLLYDQMLGEVSKHAWAYLAR